MTVGQRVAIEINRAYAEGLIERGKQARKEGGKLGGRGKKRKNLMATLPEGLNKVIVERDAESA